MVWLILFLAAALLILGICWGAYRFAFCNPLPHISDPYTLPRGEAYERHRDRSLNEQLAMQQKREKLQKEIAKLEKLAWAEKQPKRKMELAQRKRALQNELETM